MRLVSRLPKAAGAVATLAAVGLIATACSSSGAAAPADGASHPPAPSSAALPTGVANSGSGIKQVSVKFVTATSSKSFSATVDALHHAVSSNGMMVMASFDQAKALSMTGLHLPGAQSLFVGNPTTGKTYFSANPIAGAVLPVRMYVWQNAAGKAEVGYLDPDAELSAIDPKMAANASKLSMMAANITKAATGGGQATTQRISTRFVTTTSNKSFSATVDALHHAVSGNGMMVMASFDQAKALSMTGLHLPGAQSVFVGNPTTGKAFFAANPAVGIAVPVGMYVWQSSAGKAEVGYLDPGPVLASLSSELAAGGQKLSMMASAITKAAT